MMKALVRNKGETVTEDSHVLGIDWSTGAPLTNAAWCGGPYTLVTDYTEPTETEGETYCIAEDAEEQTETITIDGKEYSLDEVRAALQNTE